MSSGITAYKANIIHSLDLKTLQVLTTGIIGVNQDGKIVYLIETEDIDQSNISYDYLIDLSDRLLIPGFIDGHVHAPQYSFLGVGMHLPLLEWLDTYTFPHEQRFSSIEYASEIYKKSVRRHLRNGTTTCSYFATIHLEACKLLVDIIHSLGQRGLIGKVNMDQYCLEALKEDTETSIAETKAFISYVLEKKNPLLHPVITPRFVISCSSPLLSELGNISKTYSPPLRVQSHLSENKDEIQMVASLYPDVSSYTQVYDKHSLLHERTYMAHCIHCSTSERELLLNRQTSVIHCPNSNFSISSGVLNVRRLLNEGITVGLGTDVAGGYAVSMLDAIRQAVITSNLVAMGKACETNDEIKYEALSYAEAFYLATLGSAKALNLSHEVGNFAIGKDFDALIINPSIQGGPFDTMHTLDPQVIDTEKDRKEKILHLFQQYLFLGDDRNIQDIFVAGKSVINKL